MKKFFYDSYKSVAEKILPPLKQHNFHKTGMLTVEEFKEAGDYLVDNYNKWSWSNTNKKKILEIKNIPLKDNSNILCNENIDNFVIKNYQTSNENSLWQIDDDMADYEEHNLIESDEATLNLRPPPAKRRYDISITYDKYYRTPRIWFLGTDENDYPIPNEKVLEDISIDHSNVTVTIEIHPYYKIHCISVHPCKHSSAMKFLINKNILKSVESGDNELISVEKYFIYFIKFMACIIPNLEFDFTKPI
jgi:ubiquitin-like-conjugating enzyme ATG3